MAEPAVYDWPDIVARIRQDEPTAITELYKVFQTGVRYALARRLDGQDLNNLDDIIHDCFLIVLETIRAGRLRDPARLMGFVRTIIVRRVAGVIRAHYQNGHLAQDKELSFARILRDPSGTPEEQMLLGERRKRAAVVLAQLTPRYAEILKRFYRDEQPREFICAEMKLTETQFRLLKSRAKTDFELRVELTDTQYQLMKAHQAVEIRAKRRAQNLARAQKPSTE